MKISFIQNIKSNQSFKGKTIDFKPNKNNPSSYPASSTSVNPNVFKAQNAIIMPIKVKSKNGETLLIKPLDAYNLLANSDGKISHELVEKFASLYSSQKAQMEKDLNAQIDCMDFLEELGQTIEEALLNAAKEQQNEIPKKAYDRTLRLFWLSKVPDAKGQYDFSNIEEKEYIIDLIDNVSTQYVQRSSIEDLYETIIKAARRQDGTLDSALVRAAVDNIYELGLDYDPGYIIDLIKKYVDKDPSQKDKIITTIEALNKSQYPMIPSKDYFENIMDLCFLKDGSFDCENAINLLDMIEFAQYYSQIKITCDDVFDKFFDIYQAYIDIGICLIKQYYNKSADEKGHISPIETSFEDFFKEKSQKFLII